MKVDGQDQSDNVEDRRGMGGGGGGGGGGFPIGGRGIGVGTIAVALVAGWIFGINPLTVLGLLSGDGGGAPPQTQQGPAPRPPQGDAMADFVSKVLRDTEIVWTGVFQANGQQYAKPKLVLFRGSTPTACGTGDAAMGPFYCPGDSKVYLDMDFFDTLARRLGAPGDFAQAYVVAHEVGHHVQNLLGITGKVDAMRGRTSQVQQNALSVRVELQADCFAGVWAHASQQAGKIRYEAGDIEEGLNAASKIGDDTLQRQSRGTVVPESFTHGSSQQRMTWFQRGLQSGDVKQCNTFEARQL
jgi:predicted metalloprotease